MGPLEKKRKFQKTARAAKPAQISFDILDNSMQYVEFSVLWK